jgi:hexosaminidase
MKTSVFILLAIMLLFTGCNKGPSNGSENVYSVIPAPVSLKELPGKFTFTGKSKIIVSDLNEETGLSADFLASLVKNPTGWDLEVVSGNRASRGSVFMTLDSSISNDEGYVLSVTRPKIIVKAKTPAGLFYAVQTIRQLMQPEVEKDSLINGFRPSVPSCEITDEPRFAYRGMHLDVGRHLFPAETIKKYIDMIALQKMNTFHWHLTEDQGWRIEIKKYPKLTEVGAYRNETIVGRPRRGGPRVYDSTRYGGFYTQDEVRDIVAYAKSKFVTVIPEIEMPGHALAALASYPELSCTGGPFEVATRWGIFDDVYCAGKDNTFDFLEDVLTEVMDLFPSQFIHVGGDECPKIRWKQCPYCQKRIKDEGLKDENELQSYFIKRIEKFISSKGRRLIGWDEILEGGLPPEATVMSWRGVAGGIEAAKQDHDVIMTPTTYVYLDYYQCEPEGQPLAIGGYLPLEKVYSFDPEFDELTPEQQKHILGVQGNVWTEYIATPEHLEYMTYPRMIAISEIGWSPASLKDFEDFLARFSVERKRLDEMGINYFKGEYRDTRKGQSRQQ